MHNTDCHLNLWSNSFYSVLRERWGGGGVREINITPDHNNLSLFPGSRAATTRRESDKRKVSSFSPFCGLSQERGCHLPGLLRHPSATNVSPSAPRPRAANALASQAELGELARKVVRTGERQTSAREPAPQHPPGETSEPPEERTKEATNRKEQNWKRRGRDWERRGSTDFSEWLYQEPKEPTARPHHIPPFGLSRLSQPPASRRAPGITAPASPCLRWRSGCHSQGPASPVRHPDLAAQDGSVWVLRTIFQNILQAPPAHTRNVLHAAP